MERKYEAEVSNWGNNKKVRRNVFAFDDLEKIKELIRNSRELIARGNGRCYGDASLAETIFSTRRLNKFISFDRENAVIECESGVLLSDILEVIVPAGFFLYVTPGTKFITVGGAIASDVHGKNHHIDGSFCEYVPEFTILDENAEVRICSPSENSNVYWASIGGMGLTGILLSAKIKLKKIETAYIRQETIGAKNLNEIFNLFDESQHWTYTVAWIDCLQKGEKLGRSVLMRGEHAKLSELPAKYAANPLKLTKKRIPSVPFYLPEFILNRWTVKIFNRFIYQLKTSGTQKSLTDYESFFYPLDIVNNWNRIYGKNGFIQYQMVLPKEKSKEGMTKILNTIAASGNGSFLAVLKQFGKGNASAYNSFPMEGYTLALDFKINKKLPQLVEELDRIVLEYGGRNYLAKDAMSANELTGYLKNIRLDKFRSEQQKRYSQTKKHTG